LLAINCQDRLIEFDSRLRSIMGFATGTSEPALRSSPVECSYCKIPKSECLDKIEPISEEHDLF
jgi:hypothetical protein